MSASGYLVSFVVGVAVGVGYGLLKVRSPAPPIVALVGLLGMLAGEASVRALMERNPNKAQNANVQTPSSGEAK
jgi:XapX domain-containing protein